MDNLANQLESILFLKGESVSMKWLAETVGKNEEEIKVSLDILSKNLENRGIRLIRNGDGIALATAPESAEIVRKIVESEINSDLSKASLETLSIIIYKGMASRAEVDYIRGVNSSFILRNLLVRGLVERQAERGEDRNYVYKPSLSLLENLGIKSLEELPDFSSVSEKLEEFLKTDTVKIDGNIAGLDIKQ
ncbi:MAG: SMC-Scp complex subunit ScpB [Patescibacteria group bacterium]